MANQTDLYLNMVKGTLKWTMTAEPDSHVMDPSKIKGASHLDISIGEKDTVTIRLGDSMKDWKFWDNSGEFGGTPFHVERTSRSSPKAECSIEVKADASTVELTAERLGPDFTLFKYALCLEQVDGKKSTKIIIDPDLGPPWEWPLP